MGSNKSEETVEEKGIRLQVTLSQRESSRSIQRQRQTSNDISEKRQETVCGETRDRSRGSRRAKGYEDSLPDRKELRGDRGQNQDLTVKTKDGSTITEEKVKLERWGEYFQQLLNRCDPPTLTNIIEAEQDLDIELGPITIQEVKDAMKKLKNAYAMKNRDAESRRTGNATDSSTHPPRYLGQ